MEQRAVCEPVSIYQLLTVGSVTLTTTQERLCLWSECPLPALLSSLLSVHHGSHGMWSVGNRDAVTSYIFGVSNHAAQHDNA